MQKKFLFLSALMLALSVLPCGAGIKVMSFNIRLGVADDGENSWEKRKEATPVMIKKVKPDVFGVQEAYDFQLKYITDNCPDYKCIGVGREDGVSKGEHMSIFYNTKKIELVEWGTYWLSETPDKVSKGWDAACYRTATWALLKEKATGRKFFMVNTHLDHKGVTARKEGLALLHRKISEMNPEKLPMILTGDFNIFPDNPALADIDKLMKSARANAVKADKIGSFNGWDKETKSKDDYKIIDYIYYSGFNVCTEFRVITKPYAGKPYISDHYPITAYLTD